MANLLEKDQRCITNRINAYAVYTDPPLGRIGMTEQEVRRSGDKALLRKREMSRVGRAIEKAETEGFMKVMMDTNTKEILGAEIPATEGDEAIHCIPTSCMPRPRIGCYKEPFTFIQPFRN